MPDGAYEERRSPSGRFLPPDPKVREPYRLTPSLALRVGVLGALALVVFAVLFFRLWSLQVLSGDDYLNAAQNNQLRLVRVEAPRGPILDRDGRVIVSNVAGTAVQLWVGDLPDSEARRREIIRRVALVLDVSPTELSREVASHASDPLTPITVKTAVREEQVNYLYEHQAEFPGLKIVQTYLRDYSYGALASQILGYVGEISPDELRRLRRDGYRGGDRLGKAGIEAAYDSYLRGRHGLGQIRVDSLGRQVGAYEPRQEPRAGFALRLTIDVPLQRAAEQALVYGIDLARQNDDWAADGGAIVALDPRDGAILAMASNPTYKPSVFVGRVDPKKLEPLLDEEVARRANYPGMNRAIAGLYPPGSTFKPVTALAGMQEHVFSAYDSIRCTPVAYYGLDRQRFINWNPFVDRPMTLVEALAESCDTYFYEIGNRFYERGTEGRVRLQQWARRFGFGTTSGLDIGGRGRGSPADTGLEEADVRERLGSCLEPRRLDPARDRSEGLARDPAPDGRLLRDARERRKRRDAVPGLGRRAARQQGLSTRRREAVRTAAAATGRTRSRGSSHRARGPLSRDALPERHVVRCLRGLHRADLR